MAATALITGAGGGIGIIVARRLAGRGYTVLAVERTERLACEAAKTIPRAVPVPCDLSDPDQVRALSARIESEWATDLEVIFLNAGLIVPGNVIESTESDIDRQLQIMQTSALHLARAAARAMVPQHRGHIVATVSQGAVLSLPGSATYSAAKAGLRAFLAALHLELRASGISVGGVYPSAVDTPMLHHEATHGGSLLNFVGTISSADDVADGVDTAIRTGRLEVFLPKSDALSVKFLQTFPRLIPALLPIANKIGERGRRKYLSSLEH